MSNWPHCPPHKILEPGTYMVTAGTYNKVPYFNSRERLDFLLNNLLEYAKSYEWKLQAWSIMNNHYHFIGFCKQPENLKGFISSLHTATAKYINKLDNSAKRQVWFNYWDSRISFPKSYLPRLKYVHQNPVHHQIVSKAENYPWCSAGWFQMNADNCFKKTLASFKTERLKIYDDF